MEKVEFDGVSASIIRGGRDYIYTVDLSKRIAETYELCVSKPTLIILETDWESNLTPWQAKKVFKRGKDFGGNAKEYLSKVCRFISKTEEGNVVRRRMCRLFSKRLIRRVDGLQYRYVQRSGVDKRVALV